MGDQWLYWKVHRVEFPTNLERLTGSQVGKDIEDFVHLTKQDEGGVGVGCR